MRFSSATSTAPRIEDACHEAAERALRSFDGERVDLCIVFVSTGFEGQDRVPSLLLDQLGARNLVGCSGGGIIGGGQEVEGRPAVSVTIASLPGVDVRCLHLHDGDLPSEDAPPSAWIDMVGAPQVAGFVLLPEPFTFAVHQLVAGLDFAFPNAPKVGGLASGSQQPGGHALYCGAATHHAGGVVLALSGDIAVETRVAQGCKPFGKVGRITSAENHYLLKVEDMSALQFLQAQLRELQGRDLELATKTPLFLGIAMDPFAIEAPVHGDFLIRNVMDYDSEVGSLTIGEVLSVGRSVQFHLRDSETSSQDLREVLQGDRAKSRAASAIRGALVFSCLGRGVHLYGEEGHDSRVFTEVMGDVPLAGFFCNGEIGPVQGATHLHGYTSAFALFGEVES